jgi:hypothetical protein
MVALLGNPGARGLELLIDDQRYLKCSLRHLGDGLADEWEKVIDQPIAEEFIWDLKNQFSRMTVTGTNRLNPRVKVLLAHTALKLDEGLTPN